jgi:hypothetical protein
MVNGQLNAPALSPPRKSPRYELGKGLGNPEGQSRRCAEEKNLLHLLGIETRFAGLPARGLANIFTEISLSFGM